MNPTIAMFVQGRKLIAQAVAELTVAQWLHVPDRFDNNIAWNVGHIIAVQQSLIYRLSGVPQYTTKEFFRLYRPGTSPKDWSEQPDIAELKTMLATHVDLLVADDAAGKFQQYMPYTTTTNVVISTFAEALAFNQFHEGLHFGAILTLRNFCGVERFQIA